MKITVEKDDGETIVFQRVTDALVVVRSLEPMVSKEEGPAMLAGTRSYSWDSGGLRELVKEMAQAGIELQRTLESRG